jgi:hypothetical protein
MVDLVGTSLHSCIIIGVRWDFVGNLRAWDKLSHPIMCDNRLGNMYNLRENMANSTGE